MRLMDDESGQTLVLVALCLTMLMGAMALVIDVGFVRYQQRVLQTAADSAALAAGLELGNCNYTVCANMTTAAAAALKEDGITTATITPATNQCTVSTSSGLAMTINVAPCVLGTSDPNHGNVNMAEVVLTEPQKTFFGGVIGVSTMNLVARAEAGDAYINNASVPSDCVWTKALQFNSGSGSTFKLTNCGIYDYGNLQTDNNDSVTASDFMYYGTWSPNNCNGSCQWTLGNSETQPSLTTTKQTDPLAGLATPTQPPASSTASNTTPKNGATLQPGYYANGINLNSNVSVNLAPGFYYFGSNASVTVNSGASLTCTGCTGGNGVTLYFTGGNLQPNSGSTIQLTAPSAGFPTYSVAPNMLIWESPSDNASMTIDAGSSSYFNGVIYLPNQTLYLNSGSGVNMNATATATALDVASLWVDDGETFNLNGSQSLLGSGPSAPPTLGAFALAE